MFYIQAGKVKLTVVSQQGKEAVVAILEQGSFFGESCLAGQTVRTATATALEDASLVRIDKDAMIHVLHKEPTFAELFMSYLLAHSIRIQEDLVDQLFNSSEKRLARILLLLAHFGKEGKPEPVIAKISQETLAEMIGTTRSRVSFFMNKFRKLGFIEYNGGIARAQLPPECRPPRLGSPLITALSVSASTASTARRRAMRWEICGWKGGAGRPRGAVRVVGRSAAGTAVGVATAKVL